MVKLETFRLLGYILANVNIVLSVLESVKCLTKIGYGFDVIPSIELLLALLCIGFNIVLIIGIKIVNVACVKVNRRFLIVWNIAVIIYMILEYFYTMITHRPADKGVIMLIVAVVLFFVVFIFQLWILNGVLRYVENETLKKLPATGDSEDVDESTDCVPKDQEMKPET
ncbi:uncharacterized protein LOC129726168 [Wyeomyia smithii]|uniref:uncharacterized protein LOC129726168 n=1 Tax=Wyeomyia smithii TaxID=174621 RepID=UPI002467E951|nr:uncharacterized protein LOC129726168 [Wyeomyia smithii]XP_055538846.1 uncharacterized protein LOC129726168 [Wyeomyia smithii]